ncbi:MAG: C4-dicarboxylate ABC transporter permease [Proteobacteria bacterium]|nr:MAG: C4-dicarboxylate ABC transporter permease [Pseudomonadota bacterium]
MDPALIGAASIVLLLVLLAGGLHVALALVLASACGLAAIVGVEPALHLVGSTFAAYGSGYTLSVVPLFISMGLLASDIDAGSRVYDALVAWIGRIPGALGLATIGGCTLFGAVTGSSIATAAVFARISAPEMIRHGYDRRTAYGLVASSGAIGMMIPPSILAIVYAALAEVPVGAVLLAGLGPGLILAACLGATVVGLALLRPSLVPAHAARATWREKLSSLRYLGSPALVAGIVIGGIYSGVFTATEAAAVGNFVFLALFALRAGLGRRGRARLVAIGMETAKLSAVIFAIFGAAQLFARLMVLSGISEGMIDAAIGAAPSALALAIGAAALYVVLGCFIDSLAMLVVTVPLLLPVSRAIGVDLVWLGVVLILASQVGLVTPPMGMNLYVVKGIAGPDVGIGDVVRGALPFFVATLVALAIVIAWPDASLWIPRARLAN